MAALPSEVLASLSSMPDRFTALLRLFPRDRLTWKPTSWEASPGEGFSAIEHACHVADIEADGYHVRIKRMLSETHPDLVSVDGFALASERHYSTANLDTAIDAFRAARAKTVAMLERVSADDLRRTGTFAEYGELTLSSLVYYLCSHDTQHLACLHWLLGRLSAQG